MSSIKLSRISNKSKTSGPTFQGNTSFSGTQSARLPIGDNSERVSVEEGSLRYNDTAGLLEFYDGTQWNFIIPAEESANALGVFGGGYIAPEYVYLDTIDYITISTLGDAKSFGTLTNPNSWMSACSSSTRGVFGGDTIIDYITIATTGNATDFGDLTVARFGLAACSSSTRGVFGGGFTGGPTTAYNVIDYITTSTTGNAKDFGDLFTARWGVASCSSSTRGVFASGFALTDITNTIDYITIASQGSNAQDFGDLTEAKERTTACSSSTRGIFGSGWFSPTSSTDKIEYITIATTGNAIDFGDLINEVYEPYACSSSIRGIYAGGNLDYLDGVLINTISYITIATTGNALYFGDLSLKKSGGAACSNNHGGLL
jgi:hypothetical protein